MELSLASTLNIDRDVAMPRLGLGTYKAQEGNEVTHAVEFALRNGYRNVDTASLYKNEEGVGEGIRASGVLRDEIFLSTKVWNAEQGYEETRAALERSLERLGTHYVDLYLVHWPIQRHMEGTWRAMEELLQEGKTRSIGVCNHLPHHLTDLLRIAETPPAVDQVEFHPWLQQPSLQAFLTEHDITLEAWAPVMKGRVGEAPELLEIAARHEATPAQIAIRWVLQQGYVAIPKSVRDSRILENADVFGFDLTDEDVELIGTLDRGFRLGPDPDNYAW
ncbi:MAG TPA: aldo/keto reductase [Coriobacteriia bacterium]|nr:aldo/keto reductase [Coriobacteriia bacterium]